MIIIIIIIILMIMIIIILIVIMIIIKVLIVIIIMVIIITILWTRSARISGIVGTCADGQRFRIFRSFVIPALLYGCETWTLTTDLKRQIDAFGNKCLLMGYC